MTDSDFVPFLINDRSSALLHLIDAFQLTESETTDIIDGCLMRLKENFDSENDKEATIPADVTAVRDYIESLKKDAIYQPYIEDDVDNIPENTEPLVFLDGEVVTYQDDVLGEIIEPFGGHQHDDTYVDDFE